MRLSIIRVSLHDFDVIVMPLLYLSRHMWSVELYPQAVLCMIILCETCVRVKAHNKPVLLPS